MKDFYFRYMQKKILMFEHGDWRVIGCSAMKINTFYSNMKCNAFGRYYKKYAI